MWVLLYFALVCSLVTGFGNIEMLGKGFWRVSNVLECDNPDQYELLYHMKQKKINRTHDGFSVFIDLDKEINDTYALNITVNREVDGGFKFYQTIWDSNVCTFMKKYTGDNWNNILTKAGVNPPDCPIPAGPFKLEDFVIDFSQVKNEGIYGSYEVIAHLLYFEKIVTCARLLIIFESKQDPDYDDK